MKTLVLALMALPMLAFGQEIMLDKKTIDLGALTQETNAAANELVAIKRTAKTPKKVVLKFKMNYMEKKCVEFETKQEDIPEFTQVVCVPGLAGQHDCEEKVYAGLFNAKTVCVKEGLVRKTLSEELKLDFGGAVALSPSATELFQINIKQKTIMSDDFELAGKALDAASLYEVKKSAFGNTLKFKAK
ncbi:MAG: hypothetical protein EP326_02990 [Deltaproteobacteria bacterium]|nr:MAG: hypothetical protein EP326_02990 [Deltaproteobacteria bacterium]TNF24425.1 MAG: hypothetical protein EP319_18625 [Deltaproteobacteria bacterium]